MILMILEERGMVMVSVYVQVHAFLLCLINFLSSPVRWVLINSTGKATKVYKAQAQRKGDSHSYIPGQLNSKPALGMRERGRKKRGSR